MSWGRYPGGGASCTPVSDVYELLDYIAYLREIELVLRSHVHWGFVNRLRNLKDEFIARVGSQ